MAENFPDDPRLSDLPAEIRSRFRGRSVPSQGIAIEAPPKPTVEFLIAKTILEINVSLIAGIKRDLFIAATDWVVQAIAIKSSEAIGSISLIAGQAQSEIRKVITIDNKKPVTLVSGFEEISFLFKAGETISIESQVDTNILGSIELVQEGGKIIRTDNPVPEGPPIQPPV